MKRVVWFKDLNKDSIVVAGGKGTNLGIMYNLHLPVPPGFCVTAQTYKEFIERTKIQAKIEELLDGLNIEDTQSLQEVAEKVQELISSTEIPEDIREEIGDSYELLGANERKAQDLVSSQDVFVAVRSSATAEDLPEASFAGQQATFLNVRGKEAVVRAVRDCWASLFTARAIYYREKNKFVHMKVLISAVIQKMVNSEQAGVMFTINPSTNNADEIVIEAIYGLGEYIVGGKVNPNLYVVDKRERKIRQIEVKKQDTGLFRNEEGENEEREIPKMQQERQVLTDAQILELARLGKKIEDHYGKPQDIEWAVENGQIYIVQTRAVTTFKKQESTVISIEEGQILLKGLTASAGAYAGSVRIIRSIAELNKIQEGDVMVTKMTTPDMVPAMKKAGAIITDEGGLTCFAGRTKLLTTKGFMNISEAYEKLQKEELTVLSFNPITLKTEWKKALNPIKRKSKLWKVALSQTGRATQNILEMTPDHKVVTLEKRKIIERKLSDLLNNQEMVCVADFVPAYQNPHIVDEPDKSYLCGALFTDGYCYANQRRGGVIFTQKEVPEKVNLINTVKEKYFGCFGVDLNRIKVKTGGGFIRGKKMSGVATDFASYRRSPARELIKIKENIVDWVLHLNENSLKNFLAGVVDGNGTFNVTHESGRIHIYAGKEYLAQGVILACLRLGILPYVSTQRGSCYNIQIVENVGDLLSYTKRVKGSVKTKVLGTKLLASKQILSDIIGDINYKGRIKPYVDGNLLLDAFKLRKMVLPLVKSEKIRFELNQIISSDFRMQRLTKVEETGEDDVYNFEVEDNHTYIVFTENYSPLVVWNCHAAIVSREMGTPCIVGTEHATNILKDGQEVTVHASKGLVYAGKMQIKQSAQKLGTTKDLETEIKIKVILDLPEVADKAATTGADGVGLVRLEIMIATGGIHPAEYIRRGQERDYVELLKNGIRKIARAFAGKPVWVRCSDMRTDEYRNLEGGEKELKEDNPMIGWHGIRRLLDEEKILRAEFMAIRELHYEGLKNIGIMVPFVIRVEELQKAKEIMREVGLEPCKAVDFGVMIETPASCWIIEDLCKEGISFVSFGTNDLTQLTLGIDRNNQKIAGLFDELHPAVLEEIGHVIKVCRRFKVQTSICGQAGSKPKMAQFLVHQGITSISANVDAVDPIRETVYETEKKVRKEKNNSK